MWVIFPFVPVKRVSSDQWRTCSVGGVKTSVPVNRSVLDALVVAPFTSTLSCRLTGGDAGSAPGSGNGLDPLLGDRGLLAPKRSMAGSSSAEPPNSMSSSANRLREWGLPPCNHKQEGHLHVIHFLGKIALLVNQVTQTIKQRDSDGKNISCKAHDFKYDDYSYFQ